MVGVCWTWHAKQTQTEYVILHCRMMMRWRYYTWKSKELLIISVCVIIFVQSFVQIKHQLRTRWDCVITVRLSEQWSTASVGLSTIYFPLYRSLYGPPWFPSSLGSGWQAPKIDVGATVMLVFGFVSPISAIKHCSSFLNFHLGSWAGPPGFAAQPLYA